MRKALAGLLFLSATSCGAWGEPAASGTARTAPVPEPVPAPVPEAKPAPAKPAPPRRPAPPPPIPQDARAEADADWHGIEHSFAARFPMHGIAFHVMSEVFEHPHEGAEVLGYMRRGARFRATTGARGGGCDRTWHALSGGGHVCNGRGFVLGDGPQHFEPSPVPPALHDALPYRYAKNVGQDVPQFWRVPSAEEATTARELLALARELEPAEPELDAEGEVVLRDPDVPDEALGLPDYVRMGMQPGFYISLDALDPATAVDAAAGGAVDYARTVRGAYVEQAKLQSVQAPPAPGVVLAGRQDLPLALARAEARRLRRDAATGAARIVEPVPRLGHVRLTGRRLEHEGRDYWIERDGHLVSDRNLRMVRTTPRPPQVPRAARWIHVSLADQTLIAYEGDRPVFATLVSSGKEGYETPTGLYRIHTKHVSATMDGLAGTDDVYSIEDVPWTMYFHGSYALHAAFWHDRFGRVRSHGCINLAPADARWLFGWTTPELPAGLHGVRALGANPGTYVFIE